MMTTRIQVGDVVVAYADLNCTIKGIGFVRYIGLIERYGMKQYVGIELIEPIDNGNNGTIDGIQYYQCKPAEFKFTAYQWQYV